MVWRKMEGRMAKLGKEDTGEKRRGEEKGGGQVLETGGKGHGKIGMVLG